MFFNFRSREFRTSLAGSLIGRLDLRMERICDWIDRTLMVTAWRRITIGLTSDALTVGCLFFFGVYVLAQPAIELSKIDISKRADFSFQLVDRTGAEIGTRGIHVNDTVPISELPEHLIQAVVSTEDRRFFSHFGLDIIGTIRALVTNLRAGGYVQGGSSITQQVAKNLYLSSERTLTRKISEAFLALFLEITYTKEEILKIYLDYSYMGSGAFGVEAASQAYFLKSARDVTLSEAAILAGLFKAPTKYAPHVNLVAARNRASEVLDNMVEAGSITAGRAYWAQMYPAAISYNFNQTLPEYFLDWVYDRALEKVKGRPERSFLVRTTLDQATQQQLIRSIRDALGRSGEKYAVGEGAGVILDHTGAVIAMTGGRDYGESQFNRAVEAKRQPGSSFKPFVYATALQRGYSPDSIINDSPLRIGKWAPRNYNRKFAGRVSLRRALAKSINTVPIRLTLAVRPRRVIETAHRLGIKEPLRENASIALGTSETTLIGMVRAFGVFGNGGYAIEPYGISEIRTTDGELVFDRAENLPTPDQVLDTKIAAQMNSMLRSVVTIGTGRRANLEGVPVAGKTGTSQNYRDAWFIGYTGNLVGGIWFGNDNYSPMNRLTGGSLPAMTWKEVLNFAHTNLEPRPLLGVNAKADKFVSLVEEQRSRTEDQVFAFWSSNRVKKPTLDFLHRLGSRFSNELTRLNRLAGFDPDNAPGTGERANFVETPSGISREVN